MEDIQLTPTPECGQHPDSVFVFLQGVSIFEWLCLGIKFESFNALQQQQIGFALLVKGKTCETLHM
jgi:hypothetical protein